ncbi:MAG: alpha/beta hydrolase [Planctomycetia bacterium]
MRLLLAVVACLVGSLVTAGEIALWPAGVPEPQVPADPPESVEVGKDGISRRSHVSNPRLVVFVPPEKAAGPRPAVIVVPGGGFNILADEHEGKAVCRWFNDRGFVAFLLLYRVPTGKLDVPNAGPVMDAQKAVHDVRARAAEHGVDPKRIVLLGFSAGGQTALVAAANPARFPGAPGDDAARPDALVLIYPWKVASGEAVRDDIVLDATVPPTFILQAVDDKASPPDNAAVLYRGLLAAKVPAEIHIYETGGHGFGMKPQAGGGVVADWPSRTLEWLERRGVATTTAP